MEYTRNIERTFPAGAQPVLRVSNRRGSLVVRGEDREDIAFAARLRVDADSSEDAEQRFDSVELPMSERDGTVEIGPPEFTAQETIRILGFTINAGWRSPRIDMEIAVPRRCRVEAEQRTGSARIEGLRADVRVRGRTGRVRIEDIEGTLDAETRTGVVEVRSIRGPVRLETRTGRVEVEDVAGDATLSTRTGPIAARGVSGVLLCHTTTGAIRIRECDGPFTLTTTTGSVEYRGRVVDEGSIAVTTGRITLAVTRDSSFFIDAETRRGTVRSTVTVDDVRPPQEGAATVRLRTTTGSIRIEPA